MWFPPRTALVAGILASAVASTLPATEFVKGADVSWLPQMEATGYEFKDAHGKPAEVLQILRDHGINTIRLRVFVNPSNDPRSGHCSRDEVVAMGVRAKRAGFRIMIDFHYSDTWADPKKQTTPAAWAGHDLAQLGKDVYDHTVDVLRALQKAGVTPEWVQVGNEITPGLLWPTGHAPNWSAITALLNQGYAAVKAIDPKIQVITHLDRGHENDLFRYWFDNFFRHGGKTDIIGLSYYPYWVPADYTANIDALGRNLNDLTTRYKKDVMVVEVGGEATKPENTYAMLLAVQEKLRAVPAGRGLGLIYWEPQGAASWSRYKLSCWGADGRPSPALRAFHPDAKPKL